MKRKISWKTTIFWLSLVLTASFLLPGTAMAGGLSLDATVDRGEVLEQNLVLSGPEVVMDGVIHGDLAAAGDEISIDGEVDGSLVASGKKVTLNGPVTGSAVISALTLVLGPQARIGRDVYFIGGSLETQDGATIDRDLNVLSLESDLSGEVKRQVNAVVGPLNLIQGVYQYLQSRGWLPQTQQPEFRSSRDGFTNQAALGMASGLSSLHNLRLISAAPAIGPVLTAGPEFQAPQQESSIGVERIKDWAVPFLRSLASLLIIGLLAVWLVPVQLSWAGEQARKRPWQALLTGLLVFVVGWIAALLALALILALAFFLYWISLPTLGFLVGTTGLLGLGLAVTVFWLSIAYFSRLIVAYLAGRLLFQRLLPKYSHSRIWPLLVGVFLYALLASIPYLGWVVAVVSTLIGLGALWMVSKPRRLQETSASAEQAEAEKLDMSLLPDG